MSQNQRASGVLAVKSRPIRSDTAAACGLGIVVRRPRRRCAGAAVPECGEVHTPVHASWLNQVEIYFSIVQRKFLPPLRLS